MILQGGSDSQLQIARNFGTTCAIVLWNSSLIGHTPQSSASPEELRLWVGPRALSGKKNCIIDRGLRTTSRQISFKFLSIKTLPPDKLHRGFRRGIEWRNRVRHVIFQGNSKEIWWEVVLKYRSMVGNKGWRICPSVRPSVTLQKGINLG